MRATKPTGVVQSGEWMRQDVQQLDVMGTVDRFGDNWTEGVVVSSQEEPTKQR
jgi:hypothetical protein